MSTQPLMPGSEPAPGIKTGAKQCCKYISITLVVLYIVAVVGNGVAYYTFTLGCGPKAIGNGYAFPGGGDSKFGGPSFNLLPQRVLVSERTHNLWGMPLDILPANEAGFVEGAQVGTWWRNKGLIFYTYTYEDIANSKVTLYMRRNFWLPWMSLKLARCDGKGPVVTFTERGHWVKNHIRSLLKMNQAQSFSILFNNTVVAEVQDVRSGLPSLTVSNITTGSEVASSVLTQRHYHGNKDQWYVNNKEIDSMPYWVTTAISLPFAFEELDLKLAEEGAAKAAAAKATAAKTAAAKASASKTASSPSSAAHRTAQSPSFLADQAPGVSEALTSAEINAPEADTKVREVEALSSSSSVSKEEESPIADVETTKLAAKPTKIV